MSNVGRMHHSADILFRKIAVCSVLATVAFAAQTQSNLAPCEVLSYRPDSIPTNAGWTVFEYNRGGLSYLNATSVLDSLHCTNVWMTHVETCELGASISYSSVFPAELAQLCSRYGWLYQATLRLPSTAAYFTDYAVGFGFQTDYGIFSLNFDADGALDVVLMAQTNISWLTPGYPRGVTVATGQSWSNYHRFTMLGAPAAGTVWVMVDGETVITNHPGWPLLGGDYRINWGVGADCAHAVAYWQDINFSVMLPQPALKVGVRPAAEWTLVDLEWYAVSNVIYRVQTARTPMAQTWTDTTSVVARSDGICSLTLTNATDTAAFYRLSLWPSGVPAGR